MTQPAVGAPPTPFSRLAATLVSERVVVAVILLNSLALFVMASTDDDGALEVAARVVDYLCVVFFVVETALKLSRAGWAAYWANGWNRFDLPLVVISSPVLLSPAIDLQWFAFVLVLRLGRLFRLLRLLRFIPNRDHLLAGIRRALKASVGVLLALLLLNFILALGATFLFGRLAPEHFGNPFLSVYSLFRVFTVEGWYELPELIAARAEHPVWVVLARVYFAASVLLGGIVGLSLANAVFVDEMLADNQSALEAKMDQLHAEISALRQGLGIAAPRTAAPPPAPAPPATEQEASPERPPAGTLAPG